MLSFKIKNDYDIQFDNGFVKLVSPEGEQCEFDGELDENFVHVCTIEYRSGFASQDLYVYRTPLQEQGDPIFVERGTHGVTYTTCSLDEIIKSYAENGEVVEIRYY